MGHVICKAMGGSSDRGALGIIMPNQKDKYIYIIIIIGFIIIIMAVMIIINIIIIIIHMYICAYIYIIATLWLGGPR